MIDEKKLKRDDLCDICNSADCANCFSDSDFEKWINVQPKVGEWIPCSERLPEDELDVEITYRGGMRGVGFYMGGYWRSTVTGMAIDVIAWKEPSEPWEGEDE